MRRQLFAAGVAIALMVGAASPAIAKPNNGKAKGHVHKPAKTPHAPKGPKANNKSGVSGGGAVALGTLSAQARMKHQPKGHFNYTSNDGTFKLRCRGFVPFAVAPTKPTTSVDFTNCETTTGTEPNQVRTSIGTVSVAFTDNGQPSAAPAALKDRVTFTIGAVEYGGDLTGGNIKIR
jgi:hypothetical protein